MQDGKRHGKWTFYYRNANVHVAGVPGRGNLVGGDLDYRAIFAAIDEVGYSGYVGLEFRPVGDTEASLREAMALVA